MNANRFGQALAQLFQPLQSRLGRAIEAPNTVDSPVMGEEPVSVPAAQTSQQLAEWKTHIQERLQRQSPHASTPSPSKEKTAYRASRPIQSPAFKALNDQASLDLLFPQSHAIDLGRDPALASARVSVKPVQLSADGSDSFLNRSPYSGSSFSSHSDKPETPETGESDYGISIPAAETLFYGKAENVPEEACDIKDTGLKSGFVSTPQAQPLLCLADALAALTHESVEELTASEETQFFEALPLEQNVSDPDCYDTFTSRTPDGLDPSDPIAKEPSTEATDLPSESIKNNAPLQNTDQTITFEPYDEAFSMDHLIRRNRFLSNSINHLASQYFKNAET